jgi:ABC-type multidrug transport system fused ATPase/permease subunit
VLEDGKLIEEGSFQELMEKKGRFHQLALRQLS